MAGKAWAAHLSLDYRHDGRRTVGHDRHSGPLRVLKALYPDRDPACHHVIVHPPGGIVGGDTLDIALRLRSGSHALLTTPGATRFYRSDGPGAVQSVQAVLDDGARLEWLPLETLFHPGCRADNRARFTLAPGAQMMGRDLLALGLPRAGQAFDRGRIGQQLEVPGLWLERGVIDGHDHRLLQSPLGLDGQPVVGTQWFAAGSAQPAALLDALLAAARELADGPAGAGLRVGATALQDRGVVLRLLAPGVEPAMALMNAVWAAWRPLAWGLPAVAPRVWRT
ncbi:MAG: urease accessory protein UreD [Aquabacterium sp.]